MAIVIVGIDLATNVFSVLGVAETGKSALGAEHHIAYF